MKEQYINDMVKVYRSDNNKVLTKYLLFSLGAFDSFLAGVDRNRVYSAFCNALKPVSTSLAKQATSSKSSLF